MHHQSSRSPARGQRLWLALLIWAVLSAAVVLGVSLLLTSSRRVVPPPVAEVHPPPVSDRLLSPPVEQFGPQLQQDIAANSVHAAPVAPLPDLPVLSGASTSLETAPGPRALLDVPRHPQERNLSCELRSATDLAAFYGWEFTWEELFAVVGHDPGGDPNVGFVGRSMNDPVGGIYPAGYGVHADPVARGLRRLGIAASAYHGVDAAWLRDQLDAGRPVVIWATYGMLSQPIVHWTTEAGETVAGVRFEHTFTVVGYDERGVWVNDPWDATQSHYTWPALERSWALLGNMAVTIDEPH